MRFIAILLLVALAHALIIALVLAQIIGLTGALSESNEHFGQSGIVIPITLDTEETLSQEEQHVEKQEEKIIEKEVVSVEEVNQEVMNKEVLSEGQEQAQDTDEKNDTVQEKIDLSMIPEPLAQQKENVQPPAPSQPFQQTIPRQPKAASANPINKVAENPAAGHNIDHVMPLIPAHIDPNYLHRPNPIYPATSKRLRETGTVLLRVSLDAQGVVREVTIQTSSAFQRLDQAAVDAVRKWRFIPALRGQQSVASTVLVPIEFKHQ